MPATLLAAAATFFPLPQEPQPTPAPVADATILAEWAATRDARMAWWREARFGLFVHFGLYSTVGGVWNGKRYEQHYAEWIQNWAAVPCAEYARATKPLFAPEPGFAEAWADLAKAAGMRYAVMTSKHHDGFTLFESKEPYSTANAITGSTNISPPGRDVALEFATAMRARGLKPGFYYSLLDWQHPDAFEMALPAYPKDGHARDHERYRAYVRAHVRELLTGYGELATLWFDYSDEVRQGEAWGASQLLRDLRELQPAVLVNNRLFFGLENKNGDYGTPEKYVPPTGLPGMDWEVNHTLNESYGWSAHDANWKDVPTVVRLLCDIVSKGGNLLLNVGPDAKGRVPEPAAATLRGVGAWMQVHGEAIHGTTASPFQRLPWGRATQKPGVLYLHVFDWPPDGRLVVPVRATVRSARLLGRDGAIALLPHDAALEGPSLRVERVGVIGDVLHNLGYWLDEQAFASWPIGIGAAQGGTFRVEAEIACADGSAGARVVFAVEGGNRALEFTVPATGGWQSYRTVELGRVELSMGSHRATLCARSKPGEAVVNVREIRLVRER